MPQALWPLVGGGAERENEQKMRSGVSLLSPMTVVEKTKRFAHPREEVLESGGGRGESSRSLSGAGDVMPRCTWPRQLECETTSKSFAGLSRSSVKSKQSRWQASRADSVWPCTGVAQPRQGAQHLWQRRHLPEDPRMCRPSESAAMPQTREIAVKIFDQVRHLCLSSWGRELRRVCPSRRQPLVGHSWWI